MVTKILEKIEIVYAKINEMFKTRGIIVMFHHVTDEYIDIIECCKCKTERFKEIISDIRKEYDIVSIDEIGKKHEKKYAVITFDDGCQNVYTNAYPYLKANNVPFTMYLTTSWIETEGYVTKEQVLELDKDPLVTIGYHTKTHPQLRYVKNRKEEIWDSKEELEQMLGHKIVHFAYPYGKIWSVGPLAMILGLFLNYKTIVHTIDTPLTSFSLFFKRFLPRTIIM